MRQAWHALQKWLSGISFQRYERETDVERVMEGLGDRVRGDADTVALELGAADSETLALADLEAEREEVTLAVGERDGVREGERDAEKLR